MGAGEFSLTNGSPVQVEACGDMVHQKWNPGPFDGTWDFDTTVEGSWCLDNKDGRLASGNEIQVSVELEDWGGVEGR